MITSSFLGRWIPWTVGLSDVKIKAVVERKFFADMDIVNSCGVNGLMKLWLYQHYILSRLAWPFLINDFCLSFSVSLEKRCRLQLKRWAGLFKGADVGCLFRSRSNFGLGLTSARQYFVKMQFIKTSILRSSQDPDVKALQEARSARFRSFRARWSPYQLADELEADVSHALKFQSQDGRLGLGHGKFVKVSDVSSKARRNHAASLLRQQQQDVHLVHAHDLARQGVWVRWHDSTLPFDLSWKNLIFGPGPHLIKFVLNATINSVRTPDAVKLWGYVKDDTCRLCDGSSSCTLHHQISSCPKALQQGRFTWRHNSVLVNIRDSLVRHIVKVNGMPKNKGPVVPDITDSFVAKGTSSSIQRKVAPPHVSSLLDGANDWEVLFDLDNLLVFPPEVYSTSARPDIVLISHSLHTVILIELTVPAEEGIEAAHKRKLAKYSGLVSSINDNASPWSARILTLEIGARGYVPNSASRLFRNLGYGKKHCSSLCKTLSLIAAKCSYALHLAHSSKRWEKRTYILLDSA